MWSVQRVSGGVCVCVCGNLEGLALYGLREIDFFFFSHFQDLKNLPLYS